MHYNNLIGANLSFRGIYMSMPKNLPHRKYLRDLNEASNKVYMPWTTWKRNRKWLQDSSDFQHIWQQFSNICFCAFSSLLLQMSPILLFTWKYDLLSIWGLGWVSFVFISEISATGKETNILPPHPIPN